MSSHFIVVHQQVPADQEIKFIEFLDSIGGFWWHWIPNYWLIRPVEKTSAEEIRDKFQEIASGRDVLVLSVTIDEWSGFGPKGSDQDMFKWLHAQIKI